MAQVPHVPHHQRGMAEVESMTSEGEEVGEEAISGGMMGYLACGLSVPYKPAADARANVCVLASSSPFLQEGVRPESSGHISAPALVTSAKKGTPLSPDFIPPQPSKST